MAPAQLVYEPESITLTQDDPLFLLRFLFLDIFQNKPMKWYLNVSVLNGGALVATQAFLFLRNFQVAYFANYAPLCCFTLFMTLSAHAVPKFSRLILTALNQFHFWQSGSAGSVVENQIGRELLQTKIFMTLTASLSFLSGISYAVPHRDDRQIFLIFAWTEDYLPLFQNWISAMFRLFFIFASVLMPAPFLIIMYMACRVKCQWYMFLHFLKNVDAHQWTGNQRYQTEIGRRIRFCVLRHTQFVVSHHRLVGPLKQYILLYSVVGVMMMISLTACAFQGSLQGQQFRIAAMSATTLLVSIVIVWTGQNFENVTAEAAAILAQLAWYRWSPENRKLYLTFLLNAQKDIRIDFSERTALNYQIGVSIVKSLCSVLPILFKMKNQQ